MTHIDLGTCVGCGKPLVKYRGLNSCRTYRCPGNLYEHKEWCNVNTKSLPGAGCNCGPKAGR